MAEDTKIIWNVFLIWGMGSSFTVFTLDRKPKKLTVARGKFVVSPGSKIVRAMVLKLLLFEQRLNRL